MKSVAFRVTGSKATLNELQKALLAEYKATLTEAETSQLTLEITVPTPSITATGAHCPTEQMEFYEIAIHLCIAFAAHEAHTYAHPHLQRAYEQVLQWLRNWLKTREERGVADFSEEDYQGSTDPGSAEKK